MAFLQFSSKAESVACYQHFYNFPLKLQGTAIKIYFSSRHNISHDKELLENIPNNIIVVTFANKKDKVSKQRIREQFSSFGKIKEILIFKRKYRMCLIEFESNFSAQKALQTYDQKMIPALGFVRIKFSNRQRIITKKTGFPLQTPNLNNFLMTPPTQSPFLKPNMGFNYPTRTCYNNFVQ